MVSAAEGTPRPCTRGALCKGRRKGKDRTCHQRSADVTRIFEVGVENALLHQLRRRRVEGVEAAGQLEGEHAHRPPVHRFSVTLIG